MRYFILLVTCLFVVACATPGGGSSYKTDIRKYESRRDAEKLVDMVNSGEKRERIGAMEALGRLRDPRAIPAISSASQDNSWVVREAAVKSLGKIKDYMAIKPLVDALNDEDKFVRESALKGLHQTVISLAKTKDLRFFKPLLNAVRTGDNLTKEGVNDVLLVGVNTLRRFQDTNLFKPLFAALKEDNYYVREAAARLLGDIKDASVVSPLIEAQEDTNKLVRDAAAESLQRIQDTDAIQPLLKALSSDNIEIQTEATKALSKFSDLESVELIIKALQHDDNQVRIGAAKALGDIGSAHAVKPLIPLLKDSDSEVRYAASQSLQLLSWYPETEDDKATYCVASQKWDDCVTLGKIAIPYLLVALNDNNSAVRGKASNALYLMKWTPGDDQQASKYCVAQKDWDKCVELGDVAVPYLKNELQNSSTELRAVAARTLGRIGVVACIEPLTNALQDSDQNVRIEAIRALGEIDDPQSINSLVKGLDNSNRFVRLEAAEVLDGKIEGYNQAQTETTVKSLIVALNDNNRNVRRMAARLLGKLKNPQATKPLIKALEDSEFDVREEASLALRNIKDPQAIQPLVQALNSKNAEVRAHVVKTLGGFRDHRAIEPLMTTVKDSNPDVRVAAVQVLGTIGDPRATNPIIAALNDDNEKVRMEAATVLGKTNNSQVIPPLIKKLEDKIVMVRTAAAESLLDLNWKPSSDQDKGKYCLIKNDWARCIELGKAAVEPLITELNQEDSEIKIPVARTLGEIKDKRAISPLIQYMENAKQVRNRAEQLEIYDVVKSALVDIGKPSIGHVIPKLTDWYLAPYVAQVLVTLNWKPTSDEELVHFKVALREKQAIETSWELFRKVLVQDLNSKELIRIENALYALIGIGRKEVMDDLITTLNDKGNITLAEAYINSGHDKLVYAAEMWAINNGHKVHQFKKGTQPVVWGEL